MFDETSDNSIFGNLAGEGFWSMNDLSFFVFWYRSDDDSTESCFREELFFDLALDVGVSFEVAAANSNKNIC